MSEDTRPKFSEVEHYLPPESPHNYILHDQYLQDRFGDSSIKSIRKEIEGMVRLYNHTENKIDQDAREVLLELLLIEIEELDYFEDEVASAEAKGFQD